MPPKKNDTKSANPKAAAAAQKVPANEKESSMSVDGNDSDSSDEVEFIEPPPTGSVSSKSGATASTTSSGAPAIPVREVAVMSLTAPIPSQSSKDPPPAVPSTAESKTGEEGPNPGEKRGHSNTGVAESIEAEVTRERTGRGKAAATTGGSETNPKTAGSSDESASSSDSQVHKKAKVDGDSSPAPPSGTEGDLDPELRAELAMLKVKHQRAVAQAKAELAYLREWNKQHEEEEARRLVDEQKAVEEDAKQQAAYERERGARLDQATERTLVQMAAQNSSQAVGQLLKHAAKKASTGAQAQRRPPLTPAAQAGIFKSPAAVAAQTRDPNRELDDDGNVIVDYGETSESDGGKGTAENPESSADDLQRASQPPTRASSSQPPSSAKGDVNVYTITGSTLETLSSLRPRDFKVWHGKAQVLKQHRVNFQWHEHVEARLYPTIDAKIGGSPYAKKWFPEDTNFEDPKAVRAEWTSWSLQTFNDRFPYIFPDSDTATPDSLGRELAKIKLVYHGENFGKAVDEYLTRIDEEIVPRYEEQMSELIRLVLKAIKSTSVAGERLQDDIKQPSEPTSFYALRRRFVTITERWRTAEQSHGWLSGHNAGTHKGQSATHTSSRPANTVPSRSGGSPAPRPSGAGDGGAANKKLHRQLPKSGTASEPCRLCGMTNHATSECMKSSHPDRNTEDRPWAESTNGKKWRNEGHAFLPNSRRLDGSKWTNPKQVPAPVRQKKG